MEETDGMKHILGKKTPDIYHILIRQLQLQLQLRLWIGQRGSLKIKTIILLFEPKILTLSAIVHISLVVLHQVSTVHFLPFRDLEE